MSYRLEQQIKGLRGTLTKAAPLAKLTWLRVGGIADWLFTPADADDLQNFLRQCPSDIPVMPLGAGSNTLVRDGGVEGVVIHLAKNINALSHATGELRAEAGCSDAEVARYAAKAGLTGLEFMVTIPGTIGGGLIMNAGCYGKEFKDVLIRAEGFQRDGTPFSITPVDIEMRYRNTSVPEGWIFTAAHFEVANSVGEDIRGRMKEMIAARADSQPVGVRTGGSTFANPDGTKAWQIIDAAGCRGLQCGDASISEKHCNFLINKGNASADDLEQLGEQVRDAVETKSGIRLRWEIKRIGRKGATDASI